MLRAKVDVCLAYKVWSVQYQSVRSMLRAKVDVLSVWHTRCGQCINTGPTVQVLYSKVSREEDFYTLNAHFLNTANDYSTQQIRFVLK